MPLLLYFLDKFYSLISYNLMQEPNKIKIMAKLQTKLNHIHVYQVDLACFFLFLAVGGPFNLTSSTNSSKVHLSSLKDYSNQ